MKRLGPALFFLLAVVFSHGQHSETVRDRHVTGALLSEVTHIQPGQPFQVGLLLEHDEGWHTYWKVSATGYATSIEWDLPQGFEAGPIQWPAPSVYLFQGYTEYVYGGELLLIVTLTPPEGLPEGEVEIGFTADWLMCKEACVPGGMRSTLKIPVKQGTPEPVKEWKGLFESARMAQPASPDPLDIKAWLNGPAITASVQGVSLPVEAFFFDEQGLIQPESGLGRIDKKTDTLVFNLPLASAEDAPERLTGVIKAAEGMVFPNGRTAILVDVPVGPSAPLATTADTISWSSILLLAFIGGLILNLMPCVFPVLGIKIMGFVHQAGESRGKVVAHGLIFSAGVLLSFWVLAIVLLILRSGGSQLGWGFQLQSPAFVLALTFLLFAFALNMSGLFEVGQSAIGVGSRLSAKGGLGGTFFSGVLATVVATPCAAPFLAPALGAALALPPLQSMSVFTFIALGLSTPYLLLSSFPALISWLPKPGAWMEAFKQFMGFLLYATVAYLLWVLAGQLTDEGGFGAFSLLKVLMGLVILALALWIYGRWAAFHRPKGTRRLAAVVAAILAIMALILGFSGTQPPAEGANQVRWEEWAPGKAEALAREGRVVYVDFTARWCVTCQTNKAAVFSSGKVRQVLRELDAVLLKADWTNRDPLITQALAENGRSAVPFNLVYGPNTPEPIVLPEILTPGTVIDAILKASGD